MSYQWNSLKDFSLVLQLLSEQVCRIKTLSRLAFTSTCNVIFNFSPICFMVLNDKYQSKVKWFHMSDQCYTGALSCVGMGACACVCESGPVDLQATFTFYSPSWRSLVSKGVCVGVCAYHIKKCAFMCVCFDPVACHEFPFSQILISVVIRCLSGRISPYLSLFLCTCANVAACQVFTICMHAGHVVCVYVQWWEEVKIISLHLILLLPRASQRHISFLWSVSWWIDALTESCGHRESSNYLS